MASRHILIVDDEPQVAFFLGKTLERSNQDWRVSIAHSGAEALEVLNASPVDLLVTDLRMPGITGLELIRWVRVSSPQTRTILITAYDNGEIEADARHLEAYRYITKPLNIGDFTQAVQEALRDMAISRPGLVILSDESFEAISQQLEKMRYDIGALCILLADMQGHRLAQVGDTTGLDTTTLLSLLARGLATSGELARQFGSGQAVNLNFHEGSRYDIYSTSVGDNLFLAIIYDRRVQTSPIGIVWLYTQRAVEGLLSILSTAETTLPTQSLDADSGPPPMEELDTLFPGPPSQGEGNPLPSPLSRVEEGRTWATDIGQSWPAGMGEPALNNGEGSAPGDPPPRGAAEGKHADGDEPEQELLDMETAIARGLIPADLGREYAERT
jgi:DNA-binding response OmpR family regulator